MRMVADNQIRSVLPDFSDQELRIGIGRNVILSAAVHQNDDKVGSGGTAVPDILTQTLQIDGSVFRRPVFFHLRSNRLRRFQKMNGAG